jgi:hypothetical protein
MEGKFIFLNPFKLKFCNKKSTNPDHNCQDHTDRLKPELHVYCFVMYVTLFQTSF